MVSVSCLFEVVTDNENVLWMCRPHEGAAGKADALWSCLKRWRELVKVVWNLIIIPVSCTSFLVREDDSASLLLLLFTQQICSRDRGMASALTTGWHFCGIKGDPSASKELTLPALTFSKVEIKAPLQKIYGNWNGLQCVCQVSGALTCARAHTHQTWAAWPADDVHVLRSFHQAFQHLRVSHRTSKWGICWITCFHYAREQIKRRGWALQEIKDIWT